MFEKQIMVSYADAFRWLLLILVLEHAAAPYVAVDRVIKTTCASATKYVVATDAAMDAVVVEHAGAQMIVE